MFKIYTSKRYVDETFKRIMTQTSRIDSHKAKLDDAILHDFY